MLVGSRLHQYRQRRLLGRPHNNFSIKPILKNGREEHSSSNASELGEGIEADNDETIRAFLLNGFFRLRPHTAFDRFIAFGLRSSPLSRPLDFKPLR